MKEIFVVNQVVYGKTLREKPIHAFSSMEEAKRFCDRFIGDKVTLEDGQIDSLHIDDYYQYIEYSRYTCEYGEITLRIRKVAFD